MGARAVCATDALSPVRRAVGVAHFAGSRGSARDTLIRRFAFKLMDVRVTGAVDQVRFPWRSAQPHSLTAPQPHSMRMRDRRTRLTD
jgi:hypothetical protein